MTESFFLGSCAREAAGWAARGCRLGCSLLRPRCLQLEEAILQRLHSDGRARVVERHVDRDGPLEAEVLARELAWVGSGLGLGLGLGLGFDAVRHRKQGHARRAARHA